MELGCEDEIIGLSYLLPVDWVEAITGNLRPGVTGVQYRYDFRRTMPFKPEMLQAGGLSRDFTDDREGSLTDFAGFQTDTLTERCGQFEGGQICEQPDSGVLLVFVFPQADHLCLDGSPLLERPLAFVAIDLPENELVNGFVFAGDYLSDAMLAEYEEDLKDLTESDELPGKPCDAFRRSRFSVQMLELVAAVRNEILDEPTLDALTQWRQLGASIESVEE